MRFFIASICFLYSLSCASFCATEDRTFGPESLTITNGGIMVFISNNEDPIFVDSILYLGNGRYTISKEMYVIEKDNEGKVLSSKKIK